MKNKIYNKIKKYGLVAVFSFFLIKGLLWLIIPAVAIWLIP